MNDKQRKIYKEIQQQRLDRKVVSDLIKEVEQQRPLTAAAVESKWQRWCDLRTAYDKYTETIDGLQDRLVKARKNYRNQTSKEWEITLQPKKSIDKGSTKAPSSKDLKPSSTTYSSLSLQ